MKIGDFVVMKGFAGTPMTIGAVHEDGTVQCFWFDSERRLEAQWIPMAILEPIPPLPSNSEQQ